VKGKGAAIVLVAFVCMSVCMYVCLSVSFLYIR